MGDYDWHIATDTNQWSDQLYRIYGHEPQSFNACYERFLSFIHPDDRERITGIHQQAYASGEPYQMIERIVRPDGEIRYLSSNGQVIQDDAGTPVRMRGTCIDITDTVSAEHARERLARTVPRPGRVLPRRDPGRRRRTAGRAGQCPRRPAARRRPVGHHIGDVLAGRTPDAEQVPATGLDGRELSSTSRPRRSATSRTRAWSRCSCTTRSRGWPTSSWPRLCARPRCAGGRRWRSTTTSCRG